MLDPSSATSRLRAMFLNVLRMAGVKVTNPIGFGVKESPNDLRENSRTVEARIAEELDIQRPLRLKCTQKVVKLAQIQTRHKRALMEFVNARHIVKGVVPLPLYEGIQCTNGSRRDCGELRRLPNFPAESVELHLTICAHILPDEQLKEVNHDGVQGILERRVARVDGLCTSSCSSSSNLRPSSSSCFRSRQRTGHSSSQSSTALNPFIASIISRPGRLACPNRSRSSRIASPTLRLTIPKLSLSPPTPFQTFRTLK